MAEHDGVPVGHLDARWTDLTVPGGVRLDAAVVSGRSVHSEHDEQGVLSGLMERVLVRARETGHIAACMTSPEGSSHGQFGFGVATDTTVVEIDSGAARPVHRPAEGAVEVLDHTDAAGALPEMYDRCARSRVGTIGRTAQAWRTQLGSSTAVHRDSTGLADGYVCYDAATASPSGTVHELWGATNEIERALWAHLLSIDDISRWSGRRPADDPIRFAVADVRAFRSGGRSDELWLRLLDVDVALGTREYRASSATVTLRVLDPMFSANTGTFRIDAYGSFRSQVEPDLELGIDALSAVYLGGTSFHDLHGAGRIRERRSGAVRDADGLFGGERLPYCGSTA